jgi:hypothetical protein
MQLDLAKQLGLIVAGKPHPRMGNLSSPRHEDHPELWRLWSHTSATSKLKGLTSGPDGMAYERAVRGFHLLAPMIKDTGAGAKAKEKDDVRRARQYRGRITLMLVVVHSRHYDEILAHEGIHVNNIPSWDVIEFSDNLSDVECVQHLTSRGVTPDELADANQYAFDWLEAIQQGEKDVQVRIAINQLLNVPRADNTVWPDHMSYHYDSTYNRWMPTLPVTPTVTTQVPSGTSGPTPTITRVVPAVAVATDVPSTLTDENVNMDAPPNPPGDTMEDETMAAPGGN